MVLSHLESLSLGSLWRGQARSLIHGCGKILAFPAESSMLQKRTCQYADGRYCSRFELLSLGICRSSSMLMEFMAARLGGLDGQLLVPDGNREQPLDDLGQQKSGLDTMQAIEDALPTSGA